MKNFKVGDIVTITERMEAYYSKYVGNEECFLEPAETGVIAAVRVPKVRSSPGGDYFCCIDFQKYGRKWRTSASYQFIKRVKS